MAPEGVNSRGSWEDALQQAGKPRVSLVYLWLHK